MTYSVCDAIDFLVADLQTQRVALGLPAFSVISYAQPLWEDAGMIKPILAVYAYGDDPVVLDTIGEYVNHSEIRVGWFCPIPDSLESLIIDPVKSRAAITQFESIVARLKLGFAQIPGYVPQTECTVTKVRFGKVRGGVFGGEATIKVVTYA